MHTVQSKLRFYEISRGILSAHFIWRADIYVIEIGKPTRNESISPLLWSLNLPENICATLLFSKICLDWFIGFYSCCEKRASMRLRMSQLMRMEKRLHQRKFISNNLIILLYNEYNSELSACWQNPVPLNDTKFIRFSERRFVSEIRNIPKTSAGHRFVAGQHHLFFFFYFVSLILSV